MSRTELTHCGNLEYRIWRESDESKWYNLEEHEEPQYEISILIRNKTEQIVLRADSEEVMMKSDGFDELRMTIDYALHEFDMGLRKRMVDDLMNEIWNEGVGYCRCYCELSYGPMIVMEIAELVGDEIPLGLKIE